MSTLKYFIEKLEKDQQCLAETGSLSWDIYYMLWSCKYQKFISMINTTFESFKTRNTLIFQHFSFYEQLKFHAQLS